MDHEYDAILRTLMTYMMEDPRQISNVMDMVLVCVRLSVPTMPISASTSSSWSKARMCVTSQSSRWSDMPMRLIERESGFTKGRISAMRGTTSRGGTLLVVEDDPALREMVADNFRMAGYGVREAGDVAEARALVDEQLPSLVLLDWMLPDGVGLNCCAASGVTTGPPNYRSSC